jgi:hypothetical protein
MVKEKWFNTEKIAMNEKILYLDMDKVPVDFHSGIDRLSEEAKAEYEGRLDDVPSIFSLIEPMPGAVEAARLLSQYFDRKIIDEIDLDITPNEVKKKRTRHFCCFTAYFCTIKTKAKWKKISL